MKNCSYVLLKGNPDHLDKNLNTKTLSFSLKNQLRTLLSLLLDTFGASCSPTAFPRRPDSGEWVLRPGPSDSQISHCHLTSAQPTLYILQLELWGLGLRHQAGSVLTAVTEAALPCGPVRQRLSPHPLLVMEFYKFQHTVL